MIIIAFIFLVIGLLGSVAPVLPGPPLSFVGLLLLQWSGRGDFSPVFLWVWGGIAIAVTVMDYILPSIMAKRFGGSKSAAVGSFIGTVAGMFFLPWGLIFGPFLGAFVGELIHNSKDTGKAFKTAAGAFLAFIVGSGAKLIASGIMLSYAIGVFFSSPPVV